MILGEKKKTLTKKKKTIQFWNETVDNVHE